MTEHSKKKVIVPSGLFENEIGPGAQSQHSTGTSAETIPTMQTKYNCLCVDSVLVV